MGTSIGLCADIAIMIRSLPIQSLELTSELTLTMTLRARSVGTRCLWPWSLAVLIALTLFIFGDPSAASLAVPAPPAASAHSPDAHLGWAYDALKDDRYEVAAAEFRAALKLDPKLTLRARFPLAVALFEMKKPDEARQEFEAVRREVGDQPNVLYYLGRIDIDEAHFESAIRNLNQAAAKPPFPDTAYYLGFAYFKHGDLAAAEKWLKEAFRLNPRDARVQYQLGFVYRKEGREEDARKTLAALGTLYGQHGDLEAALKPFRRAAELAPQSPQMLYNLALTYYQLNQFAQARIPLAKAIERWPDLFQVHALYGAVLFKLGEDSPAYLALQRARQLNPQDPGTTDLLYTITLTLAGKAQSAGQYSNSLR